MKVKHIVYFAWEWEWHLDKNVMPQLLVGIHPYLFPPPSRGRIKEGGRALVTTRN
jgi:hypothetical protein